MKKALIFLIIMMFAFAGSSQRVEAPKKPNNVIIIRVFDEAGNIVFSENYYEAL